MEATHIQAFWGKTPRGIGNSSETVFNDTEGQRSYKPVLHHLMDVAAVALQWQQLNRARLEREAALLNASPECLSKITAFLAGIHDLGKFSRSFQAKVPELWPEQGLGQRSEVPDRPHWRNTAILLRAEPIAQEFASLFPGIPYDISPIIAAIAGHHGRPPEGGDVNADVGKARRDQQLGEECVDAAHTAFCMLWTLIEPLPLSSLQKQKQAVQWSWRLSGLVTLADWVGSDLNYFSFESVETRLENYWDRALTQAEKALVEKGLQTQSPESRPSYANFAPHAAARPRPMQKLAEEAPIKDGAQLFILEDTTGAGKTEAAIMLAARMMAAGKGEGLYFALPTMATANAMYGRLAGTYQKLFETSASEDLSLVLAHGRSNLSEAFRTIVNPTDMVNGSEDETASAFCAQWIADDRRKAFYADVGAGTIDQAFLSILPKRHLTLRQYGLAGRILIVDEAHCFDSYMGEELSALLELHAQNGGSTIVLSATLSLAQRRDMTEAFAKGLGLRDPEYLSDQLCSEAYPLLTSATIGGVQECKPGFASTLRPSVTVERLPDRTTAETRALSAAKKGAAVLVICNAVDEAITAYESLANQVDHIHLFHARFAQGDRQKIEEDVLRRFGRNAKPADRGGHILVATQVVEQSLDLDFDLVVSDLAPVDLIIQRAGRMWRHLDKRPRERRPVEKPHILVVSPDPDQLEDENWLEPVLGKAAFVYRRADVMWRSAKALFDAGCIDTPESFRPLIKRVYANEDVPPALEEKQLDDVGTESGERSLGQFNVVRLQDGYGNLPTDLSGTEDIGTRLGEETVTLRLARLEENRLIPRCRCTVPDDDLNRAWALSEIRVRKNFLAGALPSSEDQPLQEQAKSDWPEWEREILIAVVEEDGRVRLEGAKDEGYFMYCAQLGFRFVVPQTRE